jgi:hypothetical protein
MTNFDPELSIRVRGKELIVTLQGSNYAVTYFKRNGSPGLLARDMVNKDDPRLPRMTAVQLSQYTQGNFGGPRLATVVPSSSRPLRSQLRP